MEQRIELIREWREGESITVLADAYRVSRKTIYKWIARYESEGSAGLEAQGRTPQSSAQDAARCVAAIALALDREAV